MFQKGFLLLSFLLFITTLTAVQSKKQPQNCIVGNGTCLTGHFYDKNISNCVSCPGGCDKCTDAGTCTTCTNGYFLNSGKNCVACNVSYCASCSSQGVCTTCIDGYFLSGTSSCGRCDPLCSVCQNLTQCKTCLSTTKQYGLKVGVYLDSTSKTCTTCSGCLSCTSASCSDCAPAFYLSGSNCVPCGIMYCLSCTNSTNCKECASTYYVSNGTCSPCPSRCDKCTDMSVCTACSEGYFLNINGGCTSCIDYCETCSNATTCDKCSDGFFYYQGNCLPCPIGNLGCSVSLNSTGLCLDGNRLDLHKFFNVIVLFVIMISISL